VNVDVPFENMCSYRKNARGRKPPERTYASHFRRQVSLCRAKMRPLKLQRGLHKRVSCRAWRARSYPPGRAIASRLELHR
jgi:hypothetical protein